MLEYLSYSGKITTPKAVLKQPSAMGSFIPNDQQNKGFCAYWALFLCRYGWWYGILGEKLMSLDYLRKNQVSDVFGDSPELVSTKPAEKKISKGKFSLLLSGNLVVWVFFLVSVLDLKIFSMNAISMPKMPQKLAVSGIVYNEKEPSVVISKQVYDVGDQVEGYTIINITRTEVEFLKDGKTIFRQVR